MNDENLITFNQMQPERHKELSRLGGIASGQTRARRAYMKAAAREMQLRMFRNVKVLAREDAFRFLQVFSRTAPGNVAIPPRGCIGRSSSYPL